MDERARSREVMKHMVRPPQSREDIAITIRRLRTDRGLTIDELAARAATHSTYISRIEHAQCNPSWLKMCELAEGLELLPSELAKAFEDEAMRRTSRTTTA